MIGQMLDGVYVSSRLQLTIGVAAHTTDLKRPREADFPYYRIAFLHETSYRNLVQVNRQESVL